VLYWNKGPHEVEPSTHPIPVKGLYHAKRLKTCQDLLSLPTKARIWCLDSL
jgi:hypothetical protein